MPGRMLNHGAWLPPLTLPELAAGPWKNCSSKYLRNWDTHCNWSKWQEQRYGGKAAKVWQPEILEEKQLQKYCWAIPTTPPLPIQANSGESSTALHLTVGSVWGHQGFFINLDPHHSSHSCMEVKSWDWGNPVTEETHISPGNKGHFFFSFCHKVKI